MGHGTDELICVALREGQPGKTGEKIHAHSYLHVSQLPTAKDFDIAVSAGLADLTSQLAILYQCSCTNYGSN